MARPVRTPIEEPGGVDEEFQLQLDRGAELLARGEPQAARESLARAADLRPGDPKTLGLLGQALYRLGKFDEAATLFGRLVEQNPLEAGAQVNLGLANLRAHRYVEAISHLEKALDLNPEHRKAMGYLGLAWLEHGNVARAREWFSRAGSDHMVGRCDELLAAARRSAPAPSDPQWATVPAGSAVPRPPEPTMTPPPVASDVPPAAAASPATPPVAAMPADDEAEINTAMRILGGRSEAQGSREADTSQSEPDASSEARVDDGPPARGAAGWKLSPISVVGPPARCTDATPISLPIARRNGLAPTESTPLDADEREIAIALDGAVDALGSGEAANAAAPAEPVAEPAEVATAVEAPPAAPVAERAKPITLEELTAATALEKATDVPTFSIDRHVVRVVVRDEVLTRVGALVAARGALEIAPETRRYRGRGTDKLFGDGRDALHRVRGDGALLLRAGALRYTVVDLAGSAGFFREDAVFAMESSIEFDNARLTARAGPDVDLVQLRGEGTFVLVTTGELVAVDVSEVPLRISTTALVGWTGALTPRLTTLAEGGSAGDGRAVELTGEGRVLLDSGTADG